MISDREILPPLADTAQFAITDALRRYCMAVDHYDVIAFRNLFGPDARMDFGPRFQGQPEGFMDSLLAAREQTLQMRHEMADITIHFVPFSGIATSESIVLAALLRRTYAGLEHRRVRGTYEDQWIEHNGRWLLQHHRYRQLEATSTITQEIYL